MFGNSHSKENDASPQQSHKTESSSPVVVLSQHSIPQETQLRVPNSRGQETQLRAPNSRGQETQDYVPKSRGQEVQDHARQETQVRAPKSRGLFVSSDTETDSSRLDDVRNLTVDGKSTINSSSPVVVLSNHMIPSSPKRISPERQRGTGSQQGIASRQRDTDSPQGINSPDNFAIPKSISPMKRSHKDCQTKMNSIPQNTLTTDSSPIRHHNLNAPKLDFISSSPTTRLGDSVPFTFASELIEDSHRSTATRSGYNQASRVISSKASIEVYEPNGRNETDSIEDSSFSFAQKPSATSASVVDIANWLSDDSFSEPALLSPTKPQRGRKTAELSHPLLDRTFTAKELQQANKSNRRREELLAEMEFHVSESVNITLPGRRFYSEVPMAFWERKATSIYDDDSDNFIPSKPYRYTEKTMLLFYAPEQFIEKANSGLKEEMETAKEILRKRTDKQISSIVVILGWDLYINKLKNEENKEYRRRILGIQTKRRRVDGVEPSSSQVEVTNEPTKLPSAREAEHLLNKVQLDLGTNIFAAKNEIELGEWVEYFTYAVAKSRYDKYTRNQEFGNVGYVKLGVDKHLTIVQSLRQFRLMTEQKAERVAQKYKSLYWIYLEYEKNETLGKDSNRGFIPPSVDVALKKVFLGSDPEEVIFE